MLLDEVPYGDQATARDEVEEEPATHASSVGAAAVKPRVRTPIPRGRRSWLSNPHCSQRLCSRLKYGRLAIQP
jgi:hypothetical protein